MGFCGLRFLLMAVLNKSLFKNVWFGFASALKCHKLNSTSGITMVETGIVGRFQIDVRCGWMVLSTTLEGSQKVRRKRP